MNEPQHSHFILADAEYCHMLEDCIYIGKREIPAKLPPVADGLDKITLSLQIGGLAILLGFDVVTIVTQFYVVTFTLTLLASTLFFAMLRSASFTATKTIPRADILGVEYHKRMMGYDFFVIRYAGKNGKVLKRRLAIYDSAQSLEQSLKAMQDYGYLK